jgi:acyl-CoA synthetase (AMP-forming)/AMP-acid ligase II
MNGAGSMRASVYCAFRESAQRWRERPFLCVLPETAQIYGIEARCYSYGEVAAEVERLKERYAAAGLCCGQRAGLLLENRPAFFFHWFALNALGVSVVPISAEWRSAELEFLIDHSEVALAVTLAERRADLARAAERTGRRLVACLANGEGLEEVSAEGQERRGSPQPRTECALLYTSGTTGRPKGCVLANEYYLWAGQWYAELGELCALRPGAERLLTPLPLTHMNAMACSSVAMMLTGGCLVQLDRFHPRSWWESVRKSDATIVHYLGVMPAMLLAAEPSPRDREHTVRFGFGAGVAPRLHAPFESRFGFPLIEAWAMTETGAGAAIIANCEPRKVGTACFGRPDPRIEHRVVDEAGADVPAGTPGELLVRRAGADARFGFYAEYLKDPDATAEAWRGGWFHTGDVVTVDAQGDLHFVDRKKNVIRRSGENISAVEVEGVLAQHPEVASAGVAPVADAMRGEEVMALIVPKSEIESGEARARAAALVRFCLARLAYFKAPGYVAFVERLPLTPTEKIQRATLRDLAWERFEGGHCIDTRALKRREAAGG